MILMYNIKKARYSDGTKSPWWTIVIYRNGKPFGELETQYSSFWIIFKIWLKAILFY